jgi:type III secretion system HrpE/YscL family protein
VVLRADRPGVAPGAQRLRAADHAQLVQAHEALASAEEQAAGIVGRAEAVRDQARLEGLAQGRAAARSELVAAVGDMQATLQGWVQQTEPQLVAMVLRCVREVVKDTDPEALVRGSIGRALTEMTAAPEIRVQVHETHVAGLRAELDALVARYDLRGVVRVEAAATLKPGDCIVESPLGTVDLRVESQLKFVHQTLNPA